MKLTAEQLAAVRAHDAGAADAAQKARARRASSTRTAAAGPQRIGDVLDGVAPSEWVKRRRATKKKKPKRPGRAARRRRAGLEAVARGALPLVAFHEPGTTFPNLLQQIAANVGRMLEEDARRDGVALTAANYARARAIQAHARVLLAALDEGTPERPELRG